MNKALKITLKAVISALIIFITYWFTLPAFNPVSIGFWVFLAFCVVVVALINGGITITDEVMHMFSVNSKSKLKFSLKKSALPFKIAIITVLGAIGIIIIGDVIGMTIWNARSYRDLITLEDGSFSEDVAELKMSQIPVVDRDSAERLGSRKLGEMSDLVSQFEIETDYTQINYHGVPVRVTPLAYGDIIKWAYNNGDGVPGYIMVDMTTQDTTLVRLDEGMKYSRSEILTRDLMRHLRFKFPTKIFDEVSFEIDENGTPFWVASVISYRIGIWSGTDIDGAVICNAVTGECTYYKLDEIPQWVDQVYSSDMVIEQLNYNGLYVSGFWNSVFGQRGVLQTTQGYNYIAINDDVYLYTGMTSVVADESNVGFVLVNLRTKQGKYYAVPGAEEYSAMSSAEGQVQNLKYISTFPLLLNVADRPTYFVALKDDAGLVKMYGFVDVASYQVVATGNTVDEARANYIERLKSEVNVKVETDDTSDNRNGTVESISSAVVGGNTKYYFRLTGDSTVYIADISVSSELPFVTPGYNAEFECDAQSGVRRFISLSKPAEQPVTE